MIFYNFWPTRYMYIWKVGNYRRAPPSPRTFG